MIPSNRWFPPSLADRAAWMQNFTTQFATYAPMLGFTGAEITENARDNEDFQSIATTTVGVDQFKKAVREYRKSLTEGNIGDPQPMFPANSFTGPPNDVAAGLFQRIDERRMRCLAAPAYTDEMGAAMGITGSTPAPPDPGTVKPTLEVFAAQTGYIFSVVIANRGQSDRWEVMVQSVGSAGWTTAANATGKSTDVTYSGGGTPGEPHQLQVRVQLKKSNQNYGQLSDVSVVTVNP